MLTYRGAPPVFILGSHFTVYTPLCHTHTASEIAPQHSAKHRLLLHASFLAQFLKLIRGQIPELPWEIGSFQPSIAPEHMIRPGFQSVGHTLLISICWFSSIIFLSRFEQVGHTNTKVLKYSGAVQLHSDRCNTHKLGDILQISTYPNSETQPSMIDTHYEPIMSLFWAYY